VAAICGLLLQADEEAVLALKNTMQFFSSFFKFIHNFVCTQFTPGTFFLNREHFWDHNSTGFTVINCIIHLLAGTAQICRLFHRGAPVPLGLLLIFPDMAPLTDLFEFEHCGRTSPRKVQNKD
jgi:hypothetical protein